MTLTEAKPRATDEVLPRVRRIPFQFPDDLDPQWNASHIEWSHMVNGASLTMPYLEPYLIATLREAAKQIDDPALLAEVKAFCAQEGQHYRAHRRYNELLKQHYPVLAEVEDHMAAGWKKLAEKRSLTYRLAYAAGFESMTMGLTKWMVDDRRKLFSGADTHVASFVLWHMVEEVEHKRVAYDAYQAAVGNYWHRAFGVLSGSLHVFWWSRAACNTMLRADGKWRDPRSRLKLWRRTGEFFAAVLPFAFRAMHPRHDPRDEPDPEWVTQWLAAFEVAPTSETSRGIEDIVLLDTHHPDIPVPFAAAGIQGATS